MLFMLAMLYVFGGPDGSVGSGSTKKCRSLCTQVAGRQHLASCRHEIPWELSSLGYGFASGMVLQRSICAFDWGQVEKKMKKIGPNQSWCMVWCNFLKEDNHVCRSCASFSYNGLNT